MAHSSVSEEWKRQFKKQGKKDEHEVVKKVISDGHSSQKLNHARFPVLDEDLISERGQALDRDYGGGTRLTINHLKSNVIQLNGDMHLHQFPSTLDSSTPAKSEALPQFSVWEDEEGEASDNRWIKKVWKRIKRNVKKDRHKIESYETNQKESTFIDEDYVPDSTMQEYTIISTPQQEEQTVQGSTSQSNDIQQPSCPTPTLRRSTRPHVPNRKYMNYLLLTDDGEPEDYYEASQTRDASKWGLAMKDEMQSLISNQTWELTELPIGKKALHNKWIYRAKKEHDDSKRYKARLVVKGFQQKEGVDYNEIFTPVVKLNTIRTVLSIVAIKDLYLEQLDVKTAFLHGDLDEEIYMHQPKGSDMNDIIKLKHQLSKEFDMKDLGPAKKILGMQITRDKQRSTLQLSQSEYIKRVLQRFNMGDAKPITSEPYQCNGSRQRESKKEESKQKWSRTFYSKVEDKKPQDLIILQASFPVVDEKLIEERRRAPPTFLFGHLLYDEAFDICNTSPMIFL
uniref:Reverse transcriptase Ty1/copia-type domain-containing protein n=1 Tax=Chenopodium quinoa TaxID=63459 RepID=A0A803MJE1_CHEQI